MFTSLKIAKMEMSKDIKIIDNFLPHDVFMKVKNYVFNEDFTWKYSFGITTSKSTNESGQFVNIIYGTSTGIENLEDAQSILYPIQFGLQNNTFKTGRKKFTKACRSMVSLLSIHWEAPEMLDVGR